ncbi:MAG: ABC transporter substrate-binding protein [Sporocytophaga sp.]|uniref:substrate-binding domain-containing protein n=1 Tax=Sporocytophaga sp. TaxID=2231183 RepID=UPI001AFF1C84|nr:substrate-binding domain-containing protein [Sporocytophaga sp.]MBO9699408.1 ABC transporter substrate-binding protein [Sporocytophaga sp.]
MITFRLGGVPEHFNLPIHLAKQSGKFEEAGIDLVWTDFPGGTGAMCSALKEDQIDCAILLTEGITADIVKGSPLKILKVYVESPLIWGIHVSANSPYINMDQMEGKRYAISRQGSGSHLMSYVDADQRGWKLSESQMVVVGNLEGARNFLSQAKADIFLWEKYMTKPLVDAGEFRRIGERLTPWPCFVFAASESFIEKHGSILTTFFKIVNKSVEAFMQNPEASNIVSERYSLKKEDAKVWFESTKWNTESGIDEKILDNIQDWLYRLHIIFAKKLSTQLIYRY